MHVIAVPYFAQRRGKLSKSIVSLLVASVTLLAILLTACSDDPTPTATPTPALTNTPAPGPTTMSSDTSTPVPSPIATAAPTAVPTPTATATPQPTPTQTATATPHPTPTQTAQPDQPFTFSIEEDTVWRDLFNLVTESEQTCIREALGDDLNEIMDRPWSEEADAYDVQILTCLTTQVLHAVFEAEVTAGFAEELGPPTLSETVCVRELVTGVESSTLIAWVETDDDSGNELSAGLAKCYPDILITEFASDVGLGLEDLADEERGCLADVIRATEDSLLIGMMNQDAGLAAVQQWLGNLSACAPALFVDAGNDEGDPPDDHGDDTDSATAIAVGADTQGSLDYEGDVDLFRFTATAGQFYEIDVDPVTLGYSLATVLDFDGLRLASNDDHGDSLASRIFWEAPESGDYYVEMSGLGTGSYTLTVSLSDIQDDHGNDTYSATAIAVGVDTQGFLDYGGDVDLFRFTATAGQGYQIDVAPGTLGESVINILDSDGWRFTGLSESGESRILWATPDSGDYYVEVSGGGTGSYTLTISLSDIPDDHGDDIETATAIEVETAVEGIVDYGGDPDIFRFTATAGQGYQIDVALGTLDDSVATVLDSDGLRLASNDDHGDSLASRIVWEASDSGDYYVEVSGWGGTGSYALTVTLR